MLGMTGKHRSGVILGGNILQHGGGGGQTRGWIQLNAGGDHNSCRERDRAMTQTQTNKQTDFTVCAQTLVQLKKPCGLQTTTHLLSPKSDSTKTDIAAVCTAAGSMNPCGFITFSAGVWVTTLCTFCRFVWTVHDQ